MPSFAYIIFPVPYIESGTSNILNINRMDTHVNKVEGMGIDEALV